MGKVLGRDKQCSVTDDDGRCTNKVGNCGAKGMCQKHWMRNRNHGTPLHHEDKSRYPGYNERHNRHCVIEDDGKVCDRTDLVGSDGKGRRLCGKHYQRYWTWGDAEYTAMPYMSGAKPKTFCKVPLTYRPDNRECGLPSQHAAGVCGGHWRRWDNDRKGTASIFEAIDNGDYNTDKPLKLYKVSPEERMKIYTDPEEGYFKISQEVPSMTPCWVWYSVTKQTGYGIISGMGKVKLAHQAFYDYFIGGRVKGQVVHHVCGVRACVNPQHLNGTEQWVNMGEGNRFEYADTRRQTIEEWIATEGMTIRDLRQLVKNYDVAT